MGRFWEAVCNTFRQKRDEAAERLEDDVRDGKFAIEDSKKKIVEFKSKIAQLGKTRNLIAKKVDDKKAEVTKFTNAAEQGIESGVSEKNLMTLVAAKQTAEGSLEHLKNELKRTNKSLDGLRKLLEKARLEVETAESDHSLLAARKEGAAIRKDLAEAASTFGSSDSPLAKLKKLRESVESDEAEADYIEEMADDETSTADLADSILGGSDTSAKDELAAMRERLAKKK